MSENPDVTHEAFLSIYESIPRQGPGSTQSTLRALAMVPSLPARPRVLDVACGAGEQTCALLRAMPTATMVAVDTHEPFLRLLEQKAARLGWEDRVAAQVADMRQLPFQPGAFDLIWSEGAIYIMGLDSGMRAWRTFLSPGGSIVVSHLCWLKPNPPKQLKEFYDNECASPTQTIDQNLALIESLDYRVAGHFVLEASAWWDSYYHPLQERLRQAEPEFCGDPVAQQVIHGIRYEIELFERYSDCFSYAFFVATA